MVPATKEQAAFQFGKLLAHFPRRDVTKDAIIVSDISAASVRENMSLIAIARVCSDIWQSATEQNPFLPPTGQILKDIREQTAIYHQQYDLLKNPRVALPPPESPKPTKERYGAFYWQDMTRENRKKLIADLKGMMPVLRRLLKNSFRIPDAVRIEPKKK